VGCHVITIQTSAANGNITSARTKVRFDACLGFERGVSRSHRLGSLRGREVTVAEGPDDVDRTQYSEYTLAFNNIKSQLDATLIIILLLIISISSTYFGLQFRPSSGALDCFYSLWYKAPTMLPAGDTSSWSPEGSIVGALYHKL